MTVDWDAADMVLITTDALWHFSDSSSSFRFSHCSIAKTRWCFSHVVAGCITINLGSIFVDIVQSDSLHDV